MKAPGGRWVLVPVLAALALVGAACGNDEEEAGGGGGTVQVTLKEFEVLPAQSSVAAGSVTFEATNDGPEDDHELVVIKTDLAPDALPTNPDGSVNEDGEGLEAIGEIEEFPPGETQSATFDLEAGSYVLICNVYDADEQEAHYQEGMRVSFAVD